MSARAIVEVYRASAARNTTRLVAIALADIAANDGEGIARQDELQSMTRLTTRRLEGAVHELVELGELSVFMKAWPIGYRLQVGELATSKRRIA